MDSLRLCADAALLGIPLEKTAADQLIAYGRAVLAANRTVGLTAVTDGREFAVKHLLDSLTLAAQPEVKGAVADVGTGGGFPGAVVAAVRPDCDVTLLEATEKKLAAAKSACDAVGIPVSALLGRAELLGNDGRYREQFQLVTARAVAALPRLVEYCLPLTSVGGYFIAMKGPEAEKEIELSLPAIEVMGGRLRSVRAFALPDGSGRRLVVIEKCSPTPKQYPRRENKIKKGPPG